MQTANLGSSEQTDLHPSPIQADLIRLAQLIQSYAPFDGGHALPIPGSHAVRTSGINKALFFTTFTPSLCIVAQGAKSLFLGTEVHTYDPSSLLVCSVDLPISSQVTQASAKKPFLSLKLGLDAQKIAELSLKVYPHGLPPLQGSRGVCVGPSSREIVKAAIRLLELIGHPRKLELLAPLVMEEILIQLLLSPIGSRVAQFGQADSSMHRIARAVNWLREHFDQPIKIEELATMVHLSASAFHGYFKTVTNMSPLQFQKMLRLREARRLMLTTRMDATTASRQVGYVSVSQFTREYGRLFGNAPARDIAALREQVNVGTAMN